MEYKLQSIEASCPVCYNRSALLLYEVSHEESASHFIIKNRDPQRHKALSAHISELWPEGKCRVVRCTYCAFCFPIPYIAGGRKFYELAYDGGVFPQWKFEFEVTKNSIREILSKNILKDANLLEVGAGDGAFIKSISPELLLSENVLCTEYSSSGVQLIKEAGFAIVRQDFRELNPTHNKKFSFVCMFQVLEHLDGLDEVFKHINDITTFNAHLYVSVPNLNRIEFNETHGALLDMPPNHIGRWNRMSFKIIGERHGWSIKEYLYEPSDFNASLNQFSNYVMLRNSQRLNTIDNMILKWNYRMFNNKAVSFKRVRIKYLKHKYKRLILKHYQELGNSVWVHFTKIK